MIIHTLQFERKKEKFSAYKKERKLIFLFRFDMSEFFRVTEESCEFDQAFSHILKRHSLCEKKSLTHIFILFLSLSVHNQKKFTHMTNRAISK